MPARVSAARASADAGDDRLGLVEAGHENGELKLGLLVWSVEKLNL